MTVREPSPEREWPEAIATVTACKYTAGAGRAIAFGLPTTRHFLITFSYWANSSEGTPEIHTAELASAKAMPQGTLFPIHYNPAAPHETRTPTAHPLSSARNPILALAVIGSAILTLAWLLILRGCH